MIRMYGRVEDQAVYPVTTLCRTNFTPYTMVNRPSVTYITPYVQLYTTMYVSCSTSIDILTVYIRSYACLMSCNLGP